MADDFGYHIDHHGSLVRPPQLLAARAAGLSGDELAAVTDEAVVALAHALRRLTLNAMCDGQYRRAYFESVIHDQVAGFGAVPGPAPLSGLAGIGAERRRAVPDPGALAAAGRLAQAEAAPVLATVDRSVFVDTPEPERLCRLRAQTTPSEWDDDWLKAEQAYFGLVRPPSSFDLIVSGTPERWPGG